MKVLADYKIPRRSLAVPIFKSRLDAGRVAATITIPSIEDFAVKQHDRIAEPVRLYVGHELFKRAAFHEREDFRERMEFVFRHGVTLLLRLERKPCLWHPRYEASQELLASAFQFQTRSSPRASGWASSVLSQFGSSKAETSGIALPFWTGSDRVDNGDI